jgi:hypothetical protein
MEVMEVMEAMEAMEAMGVMGAMEVMEAEAMEVSIMDILCQIAVFLPISQNFESKFLRESNKLKKV